MTDIRVPIERLPHAMDLPLPAYATPSAAGLDLLAAVPEPVMLAPMTRALIPCGIRLALPPGFEAQVRPRAAAWGNDRQLPWNHRRRLSW